MKKTYLLVLGGFILLAALYSGAYNYINRVVSTSTFYSGITVDGVDLGGLTEEAAQTLLYQANGARLDNIKINISYDNRQWVFGYKDISASLDIDTKLNQAFQSGRSGNIVQRYFSVRKIESAGYSFKTDLVCNPDQLEVKLAAIASEYDKAPVDASISFEPDGEQKFFISPEKYGLKIDTASVLQNIKNNLSQRIYNMSFSLTDEKISPDIKAADFTGKTEKISVFGTDLSKSPPDRTNNVLKAASAFNGLVVPPGETVSFNAVTGERTVSKGYRYAPMIQEQRFVDVPGGGVSQTSTTLYNTVIRAGLEVTEWTRHSIPSSYVDKGQDTTVNFKDPEIDLKFKNTKESPVYLRSFYADKKVYFEIYGEPLPNNGELKFHSELYETVPAPEPTIMEDLAGTYVKYRNQTHAYRESRPGYKVRVHKDLYENGKLKTRTLFDQHYYKPIKGLIHMGVEEAKITP